MRVASYLFTSARLGFRIWKEEDLDDFNVMNADPLVMQHFPAILSAKESKKSMEKQITKYDEKGYCYFAVDELSSGKLIGMIGISDKDFEASFTPCIDIGWRIAKEFWNKGYATEGAKRCLQYAFETLNLHRIISIAPKVNTNSIQVMKKIGMYKIDDFKHPHLLEHKNLVDCVCYEIKPPQGIL